VVAALIAATAGVFVGHIDNLALQPLLKALEAIPQY
jgi:hypothetical protein